MLLLSPWDRLLWGEMQVKLVEMDAERNKHSEEEQCQILAASKTKLLFVQSGYFNKEGCLQQAVFWRAIGLNTHLMSLDLSWNNAIDVELLANMLQSNQTVQSLDLTCCESLHANWPMFCQGLGGNRGLQRLCLGRNHLGDEHVKQLIAAIIAASPNGRLHTLSLFRNEIGREGASAILNLLRNGRGTSKLIHVDLVLNAGVYSSMQARIEHALQYNLVAHELLQLCGARFGRHLGSHASRDERGSALGCAVARLPAEMTKMLSEMLAPPKPPQHYYQDEEDDDGIFAEEEDDGGFDQSSFDFENCAENIS